MMVPGRVSVVLPSRSEQFLSRTVQDILAHACGDVEVIPVIDGGVAGPPIPIDPRVKPIVHPVSLGMRPSINAGMAQATGEFLMKLDAHASVGEGFDEILKADIEDDWIVVPRRGPLDPERWCKDEMNRKPWIDAHYLSYPWDTRPEGANSRRKGDGLQGAWWPERAKRLLHEPISDEMQSQGSCWFMTRKYWERRGPMRSDLFGTFVREFQELGLTCWLQGGRCVVNKKTTYLHVHKGKRYGRGYSLSGAEADKGSKFCVDFFLYDRWKERTRDLAWLIEHFGGPGVIPGWPDDWERARWEHEHEFAQWRRE